MKDMELQHRIENAIDTTLASLDPSVAQCDLLIENIKGGKKSVMGKRVPTIMKPRLSIGFVAAIAIMMIAMTALAIALLTPKEIVEQVAVPIAQRNKGRNYTHDELAELLKTLAENGITLDEETTIMQAFNAEHGYWEGDTIREICVAAFGDNERSWSIEQKHWYGKSMVSVGAWNINIYLIPEENDISIENARLLASKALAEKYKVNLPFEENDDWMIDEEFKLEWDAETDSFPSEKAQWAFWYINQKTGNDEYSVRLTRDGHIIEASIDENNGLDYSNLSSIVFNPFPDEEEATIQYGSVMHFWPHDVQVDVYGEPYAIPSPEEYASAINIAIKEIKKSFGEKSLDSLGKYKIGYLHKRIDDTDNLNTLLQWDFIITTDTEFLSDGYRVQFTQIINNGIKLDEILDLVVETANIGNG